VTPGGKVRDLALRQVGPGRFTGEFEAVDQGAYLANVAFARAGGADGQARAGSVQAAVSVPYPAEYRATRDNGALLRSIAERTGGRVLRLADAATWELFDRSDLGASRSARALWELAAILAAVLILLDVAWRRIAFDARDARELAQRVTGGAASGGTGSVDALRRARTGAAAGGASTGSGAGAASTRFEASADAPKTDARDLAAETRGDGSAAAAPMKAPDAAPGEPSDALARLRAARQRARDQGEGGGSGGGA
jgi:hypothetical protein